MRKLLLCFCGAISLFSACKNENYKEGDGRYSYLTADFAEAHTDANKSLTYMVNDAGDTLRFTQRRQLKSLNVADTEHWFITTEKLPAQNLSTSHSFPLLLR